MLFNSIHFLLFFPAVTALYFGAPRDRRWLVLLVASFYFYMAWRPIYVLLVLATMAVDFGAALAIDATGDVRRKRLFLGLSVASNLGMLAYFKYTNFALDTVRSLSDAAGLGWAIPALDIVLPVGISFYTFQSLSYTIDVYRGQLAPERNPLRFALFVMFYPQLVAGPIERATNLLPQVQKPTDFDYDRALQGLQQMIWGMFKKVVIADRLATYVNIVYADPDRFHGTALLIATYFFAFQIYADFSAYSDIAQGAAKVLGFDLMDNFRRPYFAASIQEFWSRWHISLSTWFRDYVYIPLGGNRVSRTRWYVNLFLVFLVSGLWHGANWTFVVWGALHGAYLVGGLLVGDRFGAIRVPRPIAMLWTFHLALIAWVFFRAESMRDAVHILTRIPGDVIAFVASAPSARAVFEVAVAPVTVTRFDFVASFLLIAFLLVVDAAHERGLSSRHEWAHRLWADALVFGCLLLGVFGKQQFIYFQF